MLQAKYHTMLHLQLKRRNIQLCHSHEVITDYYILVINLQITFSSLLYQFLILLLSKLDQKGPQCKYLLLHSTLG